MNEQELAAIRARLEAAKKTRENFLGSLPSTATADIAALLAEIDRLNAALDRYKKFAHASTDLWSATLGGAKEKYK